MEELARCRTAIREDRLHDWYGVFDLQSSILRVADTVLTSGLIHERLGFDLVKDLQNTAAPLSPGGADYMNRQFMEERDRFLEIHRQMNHVLWMQRKPEALRLVEFWEDRLRRHQAVFTSAIGALETGALSGKRHRP
ncbi:MAG: hypothetical protein OXT70_14505 [Chloroflexota bacterium]|nr:hypothetical protein [Chloroflexota bacterium]